MSSLLNAIKDWPVIFQGALGSALFAFSLFMGQKLFSAVSHHIASLSRKSRIDELRAEKLKLGLYATPGKDKALFAASLVYRMFRPFIKSLIWLVFGLLSKEVTDILSWVGYAGSLYYLLSALDVVSPYTYEGDPDKRLREINDEIKKLEENA